MKTKKILQASIAMILIMVTILPLSVKAQGNAEVTKTTLGSLAETGNSTAFSINDYEQVVGSSDSSGGEHAFLWSKDKGMVDLGTLGGNYSRAEDINNNQKVIGSSSNQQYGNRAFLWTSQTGMIDIGTLGGGGGWASSINDLDQVVGSAQTVSGSVHAFFWTQDKGMIDIGTLGWGAECGAISINNLGQVVGWCRLGPFTPFSRAFLWDSENGMTDLGTLGGINSYAQAINDRGQVIGMSETASGELHAFLWTTETGMTDLAGILGNNYNYVTSINNLGYISGQSVEPSTGHGHAFMWSSETGKLDLNAAGDKDSIAYSINNNGQIVGSSGDFMLWQWKATLWAISTKLNIDIDIRPGSTINPINLGSKGVVPVAVLTTTDFDASTVDPATVIFAGASPLRWIQQDVDWDGDMDLLFHFNTLELKLNIDSIEAVLTGKTYDGIFVEGRDSVKVVPAK